MNRLAVIPYILCFIFHLPVQAQTASLSVTTSVPEAMQDVFHPSGRILLFVSENRIGLQESNPWPGRGKMVFATNIPAWDTGVPFTFNASVPLTASVETSLDRLPCGKYMVQVVWDQNGQEAGINNPGNLHSDPEWIDLCGEMKLELPLKNLRESQSLAEHPLLKEVDIQSPVLSTWWGREMRLKASVLLPSNFFEEPDRKFPVRYNIAGLGGRYTRANSLVLWDKPFLEWWQSDESPQIINVFLDGHGPFGDCYQLDSDNSGPYGTALAEELIPYIENRFRGEGTPESRFVDGCSTGGWVALALQLFYPELFGGCFSYSPDPVDFSNFQLINIYRDKNAFINEYEYLRPVIHDRSGEPAISQKEFIRFENALGSNDAYTTSGGQFGSFNALFSPKGNDGLPIPLFHPWTGEINPEVAEHWQKYDLKQHVENHWKVLGPKVKGKIYIWVGDRDEYYLNNAVQAFRKMLQQMENPPSDAIIEFSPNSGHCSGYNDRTVLMQMQEKLNP